MCGVGRRNVAPRDAFPPFPSHYVPGRPHLTAVFVWDYWENKPFIMQELRTVLSDHGLAVDHQRKVVERTLGGGVVGHGGKTFTICGDFGLVCGVYVVPDTALSWGKDAMEEVMERSECIPRATSPASLSQSERKAAPTSCTTPCTRCSYQCLDHPPQGQSANLHSQCPPF